MILKDTLIKLKDFPSPIRWAKKCGAEGFPKIRQPQSLCLHKLDKQDAWTESTGTALHCTDVPLAAELCTWLRRKKLNCGIIYFHVDREGQLV